MKVRFNEIPDEGLKLEEMIDPETMDLQTVELKFTTPVSVSATFSREWDVIRVGVEASGQLESVCSRCLEAIIGSYDRKFDLDYSIKEKSEVDITADVRQEILLSYPVKFVCKEQCKGICSQCGGDLNSGPCACSRS